ncbi:hypothetical protein [Janthinobacterium psychrotolerans]|uniref:Uncharacterized protein n=1 Tax=Janthinobacterium psychrotolerans TaxID=1747903 RepID=A0A1A7C4C2_9BURK|nr:hypothetical protein [Janthinobacterium psychrotolerans]OBV39894.1 hypothetical protein ASR47_1012117 [Janthinobacterium psychrotolerans]
MLINTLGIPASRPGRSVAALLGFLATLSLACWVGYGHDPHLADENQLMENIQSVALLLAFLVHGWRASKLDKKSVGFMLHAGLSLLMYSFLLREVVFRDFGAPGNQFWPWAEHVLRGIGWSCWVIYLVTFASRIRGIWALRWQLLATPVIITALCGAVLMASGWPFDKKKFDSLSAQDSGFMEELLEMNAYIILLVGSASASLREVRESEERRSD